MPKLPRGLSGREVRQALEKAGFYLKRQKGSHMIMRLYLVKEYCEVGG